MRLLGEQIEKLEGLDVPQTKRPDFDEFWQGVLRDVREAPLNVRSDVVDYPIPTVQVEDLTFAALDGTPVRAWRLLPAQARERQVPCVVHYHGAGGSRSFPSSYLQWVGMGAAVVAMDFRMQGGLTGSETGFSGGAGGVNLSTLGLPGRKSWYRYWCVTDALLALRVALETGRVDASRIAVTGGSQGGGMSLTVAALMPDQVSLCMANVPSACWLEKRLFDRAGSYGRIAEYLRRHPDRLDQVCATMSYFDNLNLADRIRCPVLVSLGLKDPVCPPDCTYAALNKISAPLEVCAYPFGEHDGGGQVHAERVMDFFRRHFGDG